VLGLCLATVLPLEFVLGVRVLRDPRRLLRAEAIAHRFRHVDPLQRIEGAGVALVDHPLDAGDGAPALRGRAADPARRHLLATTNCETARRPVAARVDGVIIGSASSATTSAPDRVADGAGVEHVEGLHGANELLRFGWFGTIAVSVGASAPETSVAEVIAPLRASPFVEPAMLTRVA
jgi:hypothetical protein